MNARRYTTKIEFWQSEQIDDGYGGTYTDEVLKFTRWAQIRTDGAGRKFQEYGLNEFKNPVVFSIRAPQIQFDEKSFIKYKNRRFIIKGIENINLTERFLNIYADEA